MVGTKAATRRLIDPVPIDNVGWIAAAGLVGFIGNELAVPKLCTALIHAYPANDGEGE